MKFFVLAFILLQAFTNGPAQWKAHYWKVRSGPALYSASQDHSLKNIQFSFPDYDALPFLTKAYSPLKKLSATEKQKIGAADANVGWIRSFDRSIKVHADSSAILLRVFAKKGVTQYWLGVDVGSGMTLKKYDVKSEGYQVPVIEPIRQLTGTRENILEIRSVSIIAMIDDASRESGLIIGELSVFPFYYQAVGVVHPVFCELLSQTCGSDLKTPELVYPLIAKSVATQYTADDIMFSHLTSSVVMTSSANVDESQLLVKMIGTMIDKYKFYEEKEIDHGLVRKRYDSLVQHHARSSYCDLTIAMSGFIDVTFADGHFRVKPSPDCLKTKRALQSPVQLYKFWSGEIRVAGIFSDEYNDLQVEEKVLAVNGIESAGISGTQLDDILKGRVSDSFTIDVAAGDNAVRSYTIELAKSVQVPGNFRPVHTDFRVMNGVGYYRINNWTLDTHLKLINNLIAHQNDIKKGLVIDLRGNTGGSDPSAMRVFALFTDRPRNYKQIVYDEQNDVYETVVVMSSESRDLFSFKGPVVILGDQRTACASEIFIGAMKQLDNVSFVGTGSTRGMVASRVDIDLPSKTTVMSNVFQAKILATDYSSFEGHGIKPDVHVLCNTVKDLYPYSDKVLQTAITLLTSK